MHLKSLTLKGFKSFPDRTRLEFGPGVSVIVGPNGSGKSNITDAVLWALGEQSPLAVRGQAMQDVIFSGARGQQARRGAEVELVIDAGGAALGGDNPARDFTEISIARRLDRTGEGEYRLNGARCRLVDVLEVLSDTGLGKEMHSVVSQGRVESVVTSKPRDRRLLIEEAAGLGKHRKRRRRAQLKLARTQENLDRALDVEREARSRLRPLKRQAEAAELHERLERQSTEARWELARDAARTHRAALVDAEGAAAAARSAREEVERALEGVAARRESTEERLARRGEQREQLAGRRFGARSAGEAVALRLEGARSLADGLRRRAAGAERHLAELEQVAEDPGSEEAARARLHALEAEHDRLERERDAEVVEQVAELEARRVAAEGEAADRETLVRERERALTGAEQRSETTRERRRAAEADAESARRDAARLAGELAGVEQFLRARAPAPDGSAVLADALDAEPGYELALAAALGGRLGAAVVPDLSSATRLLDSAGADGGRALVAAERADAEAHGAPPVPGAERLADRVRGSGRAPALARSLLADAWVVERLNALPNGFAGIAVTRSGRAWFAAAREVRQAPAGGDDRVLAERNRRESLAAAGGAAGERVRAAAASVERAAAAETEAEEARENAERALRAGRREHDEATELAARLTWAIAQRRSAPDEGPTGNRRAEVEAALAAERRLLEQAGRERRERASRVDAAREGARRDAALAPRAERLVAALEAAGEAIAARALALEEELAADRAAGEGLAADLRALAHEEADLQSELRRRGEAVTAMEVGAQRVRDAAAEADAELTALAARLELAATPADVELPEEEREALEQRIARLARRREQLGPVNPLAKDEHAEAIAHVEELEAQRRDLETALRELAGLIAETDRRIRESFESTFDAAARNFEELVGQLFPGGRGRLRLVRDQESPRPVLGGQAVDGERGEAADGDADGEEPPDEEDLLGVEIEMTPAGKSMKRLSLLSGGEKSLTALAFLFAIFLARPCPFYVLDEVEAALDDLNIDRFLRLLRRHAERAQFIVVTHQKRTMEAADTLYGVSMGDDGVSKVISRHLPRDADEPGPVAAPAELDPHPVAAPDAA